MKVSPLVSLRLIVLMRLSRNGNVGGIMLFVQEDKPAKLIASKHLQYKVSMWM